MTAAELLHRLERRESVVIDLERLVDGRGRLALRRDGEVVAALAFDVPEARELRAALSLFILQAEGTDRDG